MRLCDERKLLGWFSELLYTLKEGKEWYLRVEANPHRRDS
jgi:hypothetical protein